MYRIRPSVQHRPFRQLAHPTLKGDFPAGAPGVTLDPNQLRWMPLPIPAQ
eukprot:gene46918-27208_t